MITGAAFCPHPPLLAGSLRPTAVADVEVLRAACLAAIEAVAATSADQLVLIGSGPRSRVHSPVARGSLAGFGAPGEVHLGSPSCGGDDELPPSLVVGADLVTAALGPRTGAIGCSVGPDFAASRPAADLLGIAEQQRVGLVVLGDGSARRSVRAPGYLDERATGFDARVEAALRDGDGDALADLDEALGAELLAAGVPAWRAAGSLLAGTPVRAELRYADDPFGVAYFVASWISGG